MSILGAAAGAAVSAASSAVNGLLGDDPSVARWAQAALAQSGNLLPSTVPEDPSWVYSSQIESKRWNQQFPYQLMVVEVKAPPNNASSTPTPDARNVQATYVPRKDWIFTLPISPEALSLRPTFTNTLTPTFDGVVREGNGIRFQRVSFSGTTGVVPLRGAADQAKTMNPAEAIFTGTTQAIGKTASAVSSLVGSVTGSGPSNTNLLDPSDTDNGTVGGIGTGYYQFRLLQQFLESYAAATALKSGQNLRLALCLWKDQAVYLVEPEPDGFEVRREAGSPYEYRYSLTFRAYRRISLGISATALDVFVPAARDTNVLTSVLNDISTARQVLADAKDVISSVVQDVDHLFEPMRQALLFAKDLVGVAISAAELPSNLISEMKQPVIEAMGAEQFANDAKAAFQGIPGSTRAALQDLQKTIREFSSSTSKSETGAGNLPSSSAALQNSAHPVHKLFSNPDSNPKFFQSLKPGVLRLSPALSKKIGLERERVRSLTRLDFETMRDQAQQVVADYADAVGMGSDSYNKVFRRAAKPAIRTASADDIDVLFSMNSLVLQLNKLAASGTINKNQGSAIEYFAGLANRSGITFTVPRSKFAVPFPFGSTLERMAARYLGDPDRWMEIAALNGLQSPYVDEVGFDRLLLVSGNGNEITLGDKSDLYIGQPVWISATTTTRERRRILAIRDLGSGTIVLRLDGDANLNKYTPLGGAKIHAYLPNTVNSQMLIYLPSQNAPGNEDLQVKSIPGIDLYDRMLQVGGVDLLLTSTGDLAVTPDGDCRLAVGLTNIIQRARIALTTRRGSVLRHPGFGLAITPGTSVADLSPNQLLQATRDLFRNDPAFTGIEAAAISIAGPVASIAVSLGIAGTNQFLPISWNVQQ